MIGTSMNADDEYLLHRRPRVFLTLACVALCASAANAQVPCNYQITSTIHAPPCQFSGTPPTTGLGISPNGRYVCGYYGQCTTSDDKAFLYDTQSQQFITLPSPQGVTSMYANQVNDLAIVVGQMRNNALNRTD